MGFRINSPQGRYHPQNYELKEMLGLGENHRYSDEAAGPWILPGTMDGQPVQVPVMLLDREQAKRLHPRSTKPRRLHARCPKCKRLVCAGHTFQHKC